MGKVKEQLLSDEEYYGEQLQDYSYDEWRLRQTREENVLVLFEDEQHETRDTEDLNE